MREMWSKCGRWRLGEEGQGKGVSFGVFRLRRVFPSTLHGRAIRTLGRQIALQGSLSRCGGGKQYFVLGGLRL